MYELKTMKKQILFACLIAFVLLILSGALLIRLSVSASAEREAKYGEAILDIDRDDLQLNNESFFFPGVKDAAELGITRESIDARRPTVDIKGTRYQCTYGNGGPSSVLIYLHPYDQLVGQSTGEALLVSAVMFLLLVEIVCYLTSVMDYVSKADPSEPQRLQKYLPKTLKRRMLAGGALGIVIVFLLASMIRSLGILYNETVESRTTARTLIRELRENESRRQENVTELEEEWYLYYAGQLAHLISEYPAFGSREKLRDFADSVSADYVMLFDADGREGLQSRLLQIYAGRGGGKRAACVPLPAEGHPLCQGGCRTGRHHGNAAEADRRHGA